MRQPCLVLLALLVLALAGCSNKPAPMNNELAAVTAMEKLGGMVDWETIKPGNPVVDVRFFFGSSRVTDADLR